MSEEPIYVLLDTNIWIYLLEVNTKNEVLINKLLSWIKNGNVKILFPEIIKTEWNRHKAKQEKILRKSWADFFEKAKRVWGNDFIKEFGRPDRIDELLNDRVTEIDNIIANYTIKINITDEIRLKAIKIAEDNRAPFRGKNSIGDAYIYLSFVDYIKKNKLFDCYFISNNHEDFSKGKLAKNIIHEHLEEPFIEMRVKYFVNHFAAIANITKRITIYEDYEKQKEREIEDSKIVLPLFKPEELLELGDTADSYLEDIKHLDLILEKQKPTKQEFIFAMSLVESDTTYYQYFFRKVDSPFWFSILCDRGLFSPDNNPEPVKKDGGYQIPYWEVLHYFGKLSSQVSQSGNLVLIEGILDFIKTISEKTSDNYHTWRTIIEMLSNFPNDKIPLEILDYLPTWLSGTFTTMTQTSVLFDRLLPKFLYQDASEIDISKAEKILLVVFSLKKNENIKKNHFSDIGKSYIPFIDLYWLKQSLFDKNLIDLVAQYCSFSLIEELCKNIKKFLLDFPKGKRIGLTFDKSRYILRIKSNNGNLELTLENMEESVLASTGIENYEAIEEEAISINIQNLFKEVFTDIPSELNIPVIINSTFSDFSNAWIDSIHLLENDLEDSGDVKKVFISVLARLLDLKAQKYPEKTITFLRNLLSESQYKLPLFKRIVLYVISKNWNDYFKPIFWEMVKNNDSAAYFTKDCYRKELLYLLKENILNFSKDELAIVTDIIESGPKIIDWDLPQDYRENWKTFWYSVINGDFQRNDDIGTDIGFFSAGEDSPYTKEELLAVCRSDVSQNHNINVA